MPDAGLKEGWGQSYRKHGSWDEWGEKDTEQIKQSSIFGAGTTEGEEESVLAGVKGEVMEAFPGSGH